MDELWNSPDEMDAGNDRALRGKPLGLAIGKHGPPTSAVVGQTTREQPSPEQTPLPGNFAPQRNEPDGMTLMRRAYQASHFFPVGNYTPDD